MPKPPAAPLPVTAEERRELIAMSRSVTRPHRVVVQAKGLLLACGRCRERGDRPPL